MLRARTKWIVAAAMAVAVSGAGASAAAGPDLSALAVAPSVAAVTDDGSVPLLAYYYIWYNPSSWNRAKTDYPLLGRYSSDESLVMRRHIELAQSAGIDGWIVSWKDTPVLTPRLERLMGIAREMDFAIVIIYQGLDFARDPISIEKVKHDLELLADDYSSDPVLQIFGKPAVIWSGSWEFTREQIAYATSELDDRIDILSSAKDVEDYERIADLVQGNAHYWSSADPGKPWVLGRMREMASAVHADGGLWLAPAAPGYDAQLLGGDRVIERHGTDTLAGSLSLAAASDPDAIGLISWNEFSENTQIEPSEEWGHTALEAVAAFSGVGAEEVLDIDTSVPARSHGGLNAWAALLIFTLVVGGSVVYLRLRKGRDGLDGGEHGW